MEQGTVWRYGDVEVVLDLMEEAGVRKYLGCVRRLAEREEEARAAGDGMAVGFGERLRGFFDEVFGEGVGERLIGDVGDLRGALRCYADFLGFGRAQGERARAEVEAVLARYDVGRVER